MSNTIDSNSNVNRIANATTHKTSHAQQQKKAEPKLFEIENDKNKPTTMDDVLASAPQAEVMGNIAQGANDPTKKLEKDPDTTLVAAAASGAGVEVMGNIALNGAAPAAPVESSSTATSSALTAAASTGGSFNATA